MKVLSVIHRLAQAVIYKREVVITNEIDVLILSAGNQIHQARVSHTIVVSAPVFGGQSGRVTKEVAVRFVDCPFFSSVLLNPYLE